MVRSLMPWSARPLESFFRDVENLMGRANGSEEQTWSQVYVPLTNIAETESAYEVSMDLPGLKPEDVKVEVHEGVLTVAGHRAAETEAKDKTYHRIERSYGEFRRLIQVPGKVDSDKITAEYKEGVLRVTLPKSEEVKPRQIKIG